MLIIRTIPRDEREKLDAEARAEARQSLIDFWGINPDSVMLTAELRNYSKLELCVIWELLRVYFHG